PLNLRLGEMFARPIFGVRTAKQMNCAFFVAWRDQLQCWFCHEKIPRSQKSTVHITCLMRSVGRSAIEQSLEAVLIERDTTPSPPPLRSTRHVPRPTPLP